MADLQAQLEELRLTLNLLHDERMNLSQAMQQQESNFYAIIMDLITCVKDSFDVKNQQVESLMQEVASLKNPGAGAASQ